ncbi:MAG: ABC transporter ATP-binding protein [Deltaproteobacteria bacterium]|nr:ABC transporter ATP-binding protein [Deltaproteobacteria bacterium]
MRIEVQNLSKAFSGVQVVRDVSFTVEEGQLVALLGPSGGGKSTILRIVAGLEDPDAGSVVLGERRVERVPARERGIGFVFQHYALFPHMTVGDNIGFGLKVRKEDPATVAQRVEEMIGLVGLQGLGQRFPHELSGGQRQRVALARALAPSPRVLLLDEPFGAVDAKVRHDLRLWLRRLHDNVGVTSVFVTHDQSEALEIADRVIIVNHGRLEQNDTPEDIWRRPANAFVAEFVGATNRIAGRVVGDEVDAGFLRHPRPAGLDDGAAVLILARPAEVMLHPVGEDESPARVQRVSFVGHSMKVEIEVPDHGVLTAEIPPAVVRAKELAPGRAVRVTLSAAQVFPSDAAPPGTVTSAARRQRRLTALFSRFRRTRSRV